MQSSVLATNNRAFTLIELLVAMVIVLIVFLALSRALIVYTSQNLSNSMRNEAISIAQDCMEKLRVNSQCPSVDNVSFRNFIMKYHINILNTSPPNSCNDMIDNVTVTVKYKYSGKDYSYTVYGTLFKWWCANAQ